MRLKRENRYLLRLIVAAVSMIVMLVGLVAIFDHLNPPTEVERRCVSKPLVSLSRCLRERQFVDEPCNHEGC